MYTLRGLLASIGLDKRKGNNSLKASIQQLRVGGNRYPSLVPRATDLRLQRSCSMTSYVLPVSLGHLRKLNAIGEFSSQATYDGGEISF